MKILIWNKGLKLEDKGGPSGYLYKIREHLCLHPNDAISFYSDIINDSSSDNTPPKKRSIKEALKSIDLISFIYIIKLTYFTEQKLSSSELKLLEDYNAIHFHSVPSLLAYYKAVRDSGKTIILTTHTPEPFTCEFFAKYQKNWLLKCVPFLKRYLIKREQQAFDFADFIMFPVPEAKEAYTSSCKSYDECFTRNNDKFFYVPTAINEKYTSFNEGRLKGPEYPCDNLRVCYIGRHNSIKGYNELKTIAQCTWNYNTNVDFIIGGKQGPSYGLDNPRWHELGWVSTYNLLEEIDVFVLPNKETYYDLILLEVMRSGKPVVLTATGGSKWFKRFDNTGLFFYEYGDIGYATELLIKMVEFKKNGTILEYGNKNRNLFLRTSVLEIYISHYLRELTRRVN